MITSHDPKQISASEFIEKVFTQGDILYRDLPWRYIEDAYSVLVSEVMLQQTQVSRVLNYWDRFLKTFPTIDALAAAETALVLEHWQGLGYNRRALMLKKTAEQCSEVYQGSLPQSYDELLSLPGIGKATAAGVRIFAQNKAEVYLETNVRTVFIHEFFPNEEEVPDKALVPLIKDTCSHEDPRKWYYALLDYGAHLKQVNPNPSRRSAHHTRQSTFEGSRRQKRAEIVRIVLANPGISHFELLDDLNKYEKTHKREMVDEGLFQSIISDLLAEGFFSCEEERYRA